MSEAVVPGSRPRAWRRALASFAVLASLALAGCSAPAGSDADVGVEPPTTPATTRTTDAPEEATTEDYVPTDVAGVVEPYPERPDAVWEVVPEDLDVPGAATVDFYDPTMTPVIDGWPLVGALDGGDVWVVGVHDPGGSNQWLVTLDPATGEQRAVIGLTRAQGPPRSCTRPLADGSLACLYGTALELIDLAAGEARARVDLPQEGHSVHELDGDIFLVSLAVDGSTLTLTRTDPDGAERWSVTNPLDFEQSMAMTGSFVPAVQHVAGTALVTIGELHLMLDADDGTLLWQGVGEAVGPGPEGTVVASVRPEQVPGSPSEVLVLAPDGTPLVQAPGLSWRPPSASTGVRAPMTLVTDDGAGSVGLSTGTGERTWEYPGDPQQLRVPMVRADGVAVVQDTAGMLVALDAVTGAELWVNNGGSAGWHVRGWGALTDGERMVARTPGGVIAVDLATGAEVWHATVPQAADQVWELVELDDMVLAAGHRSLTLFAPTG